MSEIDFQGLAQSLLHRIRELLPEWLPGGKIVGNEYTTANLQGGAGNSLKININSGKWMDFAEGSKGGDLISLYAAINRISQIEAAKNLQSRIGVAVITKQSKVQPSDDTLIPPPAGVKQPSFMHKTFGRATAIWKYLDQDSSTLFYVSRHEHDGQKEFMPWSWSKVRRTWVNKMWPKPRPLYGLDLLKKNPKAPVLVVEGEKAADAAREITKDSPYVVVSWPSGSNAPMLADWTSLHGRKVLLWPDADDKVWPDGSHTPNHLRGKRKEENEQPGHKAMLKIGEYLVDHCPEVKIISVYNLTRPDGWDAHDALAEGMDYQQFLAFAKPRATLMAKPSVAVKAEIMPDIPPAPPMESYEVNVNLNVHDGSPVPTEGMWDKWQRLGLQLTTTKNPVAVCNADNVSRVMEQDHEFKGRLWFDEFHKKVFTTWRTGKLREFSDADFNKLVVLLQRDYGLTTISPAAVKTAIGACAYDDIRNEPRDWMETLKWDGNTRIRKFLGDYMGCTQEHEDYVQAISMNFWLSMIARVYKPGVKADNMIVLEGSQGKGKSTALNIIAGKWFVETSEDPRNKDFYQILQGALLVEIAELDSFSKADLNTIKKTMSCRVDRFRAPYAVAPADHPRQCIFAGSTNQDDYLKDPSGARRFWPTMTGEIDLKAIERDREQLFAEAVALHKDGWPHWTVPKELAEEVQEDRYDSDPWEEPIRRWARDKKSFIIMDVATDCLSFDMAQLKTTDSRRIGAIIRRLGYKNKTARMGSSVTKRWVNLAVDGVDFGQDSAKKHESLQQKLPNYADSVSRKSVE